MIRIGKIEHWANNRMQYKLNVIKYNRVQMRFNQVQPNSTNSEQPMFSIFSDRDQGLDSPSSVITVFSISRVFHRSLSHLFSNDLICRVLYKIRDYKTLKKVRLFD